MSPASVQEHDQRMSLAWRDADAPTRSAVLRAQRRGTSEARTAELAEWRARTARAGGLSRAALGFVVVVAGVTALGVGPLTPRFVRALGQGLGVVGAIALVQRNANLAAEHRARQDFRRLRGRSLPGTEPARPLPLWALASGVAAVALLGVAISVGLGLLLDL